MMRLLSDINNLDQEQKDCLLLLEKATPLHESFFQKQEDKNDNDTFSNIDTNFTNGEEVDSDLPVINNDVSDNDGVVNDSIQRDELTEEEKKSKKWLPRKQLTGLVSCLQCMCGVKNRIESFAKLSVQDALNEFRKIPGNDKTLTIVNSFRKPVVQRTTQGEEGPFHSEKPTKAQIREHLDSPGSSSEIKEFDFEGSGPKSCGSVATTASAASDVSVDL
eukprot:Pgem_evm5s8972